MAMSLLEKLGLFRRPPDARSPQDVEAEILEELRFHVDTRIENNIAAGMDPDEARRDAEARFGDFDRIRDACRWVQLGERIMIQRIHFALTVVLVAALAFVGLEFFSLRESVHRMSVGQGPMMRPLFGLGSGAEIHIGIGDQLEVLDFGQNELVATEKVALDGKVLLPELGWVDLVGLSREEAEKELSERYRPYFAHEPDIKIRVEKSWMLGERVRVAGF